MKGHKRLNPIKPLLFLTVVFCLGLTAGCGSGGGGSTTADPAKGTTWDEMEWDKGKWG